jgi:DNA-binding LytR/AlgR family response regulator
MSLRTFIAEDETHALRRFRDLLKAFPEILVVGESGDGITAAARINDLRPDLVFLDIRMPGASGFDVLDRLSCDPRIVFVTAYDEYAIRAFEENAVDYLLKPVTRERLEKTIERVARLEARISVKDLRDLRSAIEEKAYLRRFFIKKGDEILIVPEADVLAFKAEDKVVILSARGGEHVLDITLKELENCLDPSKFCRIHRSVIVALDKIGKMQKWFHGEFLIFLEDGKKFKVSRNYKANLMARTR